MSIIAGFEAATATIDGQTIAYAKGGSGPPVLLLHGFPQTHAMWHAVAPVLAQHFTVVASDLRGYGDSAKPDSTEPYRFRYMAADQHGLMQHLGFDTFHLVGHDRGARTAHRLTLDHPNAVQSLTLMDIVPTHLLLDQLNRHVARDYYHWFFLAQPAPFPENMIGADPDTYYQRCLTGWGSNALSDFDNTALDAYRAAWRKPDTIRGMCADYRAALDYDFDDDAADLDTQIACPALVMYGTDGPMAQAYDVPGTWQGRLPNMQSAGIPGGHFFIDTHPKETAQPVLSFLQNG